MYCVGGVSLGEGLSSSQVKWKHWLEVAHSGREVGLEMGMGARIYLNHIKPIPLKLLEYRIIGGW